MGVVFRNGRPFGAAKEDVTIVTNFEDLTNLTNKETNHLYQGKFRTVAEDNLFNCNYCNMKFIGDITNNLYFVFNNSYLTGKVTGGTVWCVTGSTQSILDIECPEINGNSANHVFANSDKCPSISIATPITNNQMKSADTLFNLGLLIQR